MTVYSYDKISQEELDKERFAKEDFNHDRSYSLNHEARLIVEMRYVGNNGSHNAQGWEENGIYYCNGLEKNSPGCFSDENKKLITNDHMPIIDQQFIEHFPQYANFEGEQLKHHHIGGDGQGVGVPKSIHIGYGGIHNDEKDVGIRESAEKFSTKVRGICENDPSNYEKTAGEFKQIMESQSMTLEQLIAKHSELKTEVSDLREIERERSDKHQHIYFLREDIINAKDKIDQFNMRLNECPSTQETEILKRSHEQAVKYYEDNYGSLQDHEKHIENLNIQKSEAPAVDEHTEKIDKLQSELSKIDQQLKERLSCPQQQQEREYDTRVRS